MIYADNTRHEGITLKENFVLDWKEWGATTAVYNALFVLFHWLRGEGVEIDGWINDSEEE